jgi:hypothetical protein
MSNLFTEVSAEQQEVVSGGFQNFLSAANALSEQLLIASPIARTPNTQANIPFVFGNLEDSFVGVEVLS